MTVYQRLKRFSYSLTQLGWPSDFDTIFGRSAPLILEIGFGGGHFLVEMAQRQPEHNFLGIEHSTYSMYEVERKVIRLRLPNMRLVYGDAITLLAYTLAPATLDKLYINFPDPFPKSAHAHRRLLSPPSLHLMASRLKPGALLTIATDVPAYAETIALDLAATPGLHNLHGSGWVNAIPGRTVTRYEGKALAKGNPCHYFELTRTADSIEPPPIPIQPNEDSMPNIVIHSPLSIDQLADAFQPMEFNEAGIHVRLIAVYQNRKEPGLLFDSFIDEPLVEQRPAITIAMPPSQDHYVIRLGMLGYPRPTLGVHLAVRKIAEWMQTLHPETRIIHDNARG